MEESNRGTGGTARERGESRAKHREKCAKVGRGRSLSIAHVDNRAVETRHRAGGIRLVYPCSERRTRRSGGRARDRDGIGQRR